MTNGSRECARRMQLHLGQHCVPSQPVVKRDKGKIDFLLNNSRFTSGCSRLLVLTPKKNYQEQQDFIALKCNHFI